MRISLFRAARPCRGLRALGVGCHPAGESPSRPLGWPLTATSVATSSDYLSDHLLESPNYRAPRGSGPALDGTGSDEGCTARHGVVGTPYGNSPARANRLGSIPDLERA